MAKQPGAKLFTMPPRGVPDLDARSQALDVTRSWIVEAPAGSGKTGLLIQRYLRLLADASVSEPEEVLAITFTRAATEEIRDRILRELRRATDHITPESDFDAATRALADAVLLRDTQRSWRLLDEPRRLRVRTIDAVCAEIARALPILSGGGGSLRPIDEPATLYREAARRTWLRLGGEDSALNDALRTLLLHRDGDLERCEHLVAGMLADREQWGSLIPLRNSDLEDAALESRLRKQLNSTLERVVCDGLGKLAAAFPPGVLNALTRLAAEFSDAPANADLHPLAICSNLHDAPEASANHLAHWRALTHLLVTNEQKFRKGFQRNHLGIALSPRQRDALKLFVTGISESDALLDALKAFYALPPPEFPAEQWHVTKALVRVLRQALVDLQIVFAERGECDFAEPALLARYALDQSATGMVDTAIGTELKHLLVDEVQDTSIRQYELIERLTAGWASEGKTVFLVGDPKQSIYLFRQARVERFVATMNDGHLGSLPVGLLRLTANFRSQAGLVEAFNEDFSAIFPPAARGSGEIEYVSAIAARSETPGLAGDSGAAWHLSVAEGLVPDAKAAIRAETTRSARQVRRIIEKWRSKPLPRGRTVPWKIAVLVRSRASLGKVLPELRREPAIPVRAIKIDTLADRREILDLLALTRALLHPADRTAWLAVLHAPWCGLSLNDLHLLTGQDDDAFNVMTVMELIDRHGADLTPDGVARMERVWPVLDAAVRSSSRVRLPELVERTWRSLGGNLYLDPVARENADTFLDLLRTLDRESGRVTLPDLEQHLKKLFAAAGSAEGAIDLVTIHGAKGLEWDLVLVPELDRMAPHSSPRLLDWEELPDGGVVLAPIAGKGEDSHSLNSWLSSLRRQRDAAERKRLFYVACTRAREELHLFGAIRQRTAGQVKPDAGSLLEAAWPAAQLRLEEVGQTAQPPAQGMLFNLAAGEDDETDPGDAAAEQPAMLERLPLSFRAFPARSAVPSPLESSSPLPILRPEGSLSARSLGTAVHAFLEEAANRLAAGFSADSLAADLPNWRSRIHAILRADGLAPHLVDAHTHTVLAAVSQTLAHPQGRWLLEGRTKAQNEFALTTWENDRRQYRIDRIFRAGGEPCTLGDQHLWIIDYKTSGAPAGNDDDMDLQERTRFAPQLERYAATLAEPGTRLGLWFPLRSRLVWWIAGESPASALAEVNSTVMAPVALSSPR